MLAACAQILAIVVVEPSISVEVLSIFSAEFYSSRGSLDGLAPVEASQICPRCLLSEGGIMAHCLFEVLTKIEVFPMKNYT